jgi:hypothetical protein
MTIYQGSRYEYSTVDFFSVVDGGDENAVVFYEFQDIGTISYRDYTWILGDRLDLISAKFYQRPDLWWYIIDANPEINDPWVIEPGTVIRIPNVQ